MRGDQMTDTHSYWIDTALLAMGRLRELESELIVLNKRIKELEAVCVIQLQRIKEFEGKLKETK
jgi:hypothetical protein